MCLWPFRETSGNDFYVHLWTMYIRFGQWLKKIIWEVGQVQEKIVRIQGSKGWMPKVWYQQWVYYWGSEEPHSECKPGGAGKEGTLINLWPWLAAPMPTFSWQLHQTEERWLLSCLDQRLRAVLPALLLIGVRIFMYIFSLILGIGRIWAGGIVFLPPRGGQESGDLGKAGAVRKD